ncbi:hypothetical protein RF11_15342 [Thelohanellus kitauei]|uniref:Uncharacterized protein n=1 Tax=Thelohanellus kitauei TaxID=669202 RepID=A0A0C2LZV9_THEKT|nr:hypothetical protein RF11_15342 [Thelohanellus kitauei]
MIKKLVESRCVKRTNFAYQRFLFHKAFQDKDEDISQFLERLQDIEKRCDFKSTLYERLRDKFIIGNNNPGINGPAILQDTTSFYPNSAKNPGIVSARPGLPTVAARKRKADIDAADPSSVPLPKRYPIPSCRIESGARSLNSACGETQENSLEQPRTSFGPSLSTTRPFSSHSTVAKSAKRVGNVPEGICCKADTIPAPRTSSDNNKTSGCKPEQYVPMEIPYHKPPLRAKPRPQSGVSHQMSRHRQGSQPPNTITLTQQGRLRPTG